MEAGERRSGEMTFYVVRHGQTLFNVMGKVQGWCDTPLTDEGVRAAQSLGRGLAEVDFSAAYSSDSGRAVHTLDELLRARGSGGCPRWPTCWRMRIAPAAPSASMPSSVVCAGSSTMSAMPSFDATAATCWW